MYNKFLLIFQMKLGQLLLIPGKLPKIYMHTPNHYICSAFFFFQKLFENFFDKLFEPVCKLFFPIVCLKIVAAGEITFVVSLKRHLPQKILNHYTMVISMELLIHVTYNIYKPQPPAIANKRLIIQQ